jgi:hypothetical protein
LAHEWLLRDSIEEVTPAEMQRRYDAVMKESAEESRHERQGRE